ncbi:MAG: hypothetical protein SFX73_08510 [Kofleriaceae bacterium]|nr:hypothetical protein [Kofleriaceae bacterium]
MADDDLPCDLCEGSGLTRPGHPCPRCGGDGRVATSFDLLDAVAAAVARAANHHGGPAGITLDELHARWGSPEPLLVRSAFRARKSLAERLHRKGLEATLSGAVISITLLACSCSEAGR